MMNIRVFYFARCRELAATDREDVVLEEGATLEDLTVAVTTKRPELARILPSIRMAVNQEFARSPCALSDGDEVAFIPPVSGGSPSPERFIMSAQPIDVDAAVKLLRDAADDRGALATFAGTVRRRSALGHTVSYLEYEAYAGMATKVMRRIEAEVRGRWPVLDLAIVHRTGRVEVGQVAVSIAVSAAHRAEALEACRYIIDRVKQDVPIWKKETGPEGEQWWSPGS